MAAAPPPALQHSWELDRLRDIYDRLRPEQVLEVGAWEGGTLWWWLQHADAEVTVVDDRMLAADEWPGWGPAKLRLLKGDSRDPLVVGRAAYRRYQFVFIDADHTYPAVAADWRNYGPLVEPGGVVAFHDVRSTQNGAEVWRLWAEIKAEPGSRTSEFHENNAVWGGIGVVWK